MARDLINKGLQDINEYQRVLDGNKRYVEKKTAENPNYFTKLAEGQQPRFLLIGCSDSRAPPNEITETDPGEIFIHRNIANLVIPTDMNMNCVIQYAVEQLRVKNIIVMGHTFCGGIKAAMRQESVGGLLDLWLNTIKLTYEKNQKILDQIINEDEKITCLSCFSIREQVLNLWRNPIIQKSWNSGHPIMIHGWLFRVETGVVEQLSLDEQFPIELSNIFNLNFKTEDIPTQKRKQTRYSKIQTILEQNFNQNGDQEEFFTTIQRRLSKQQSELDDEQSEEQSQDSHQVKQFEDTQLGDILEKQQLQEK
ncbi:hypothetical protein pb186bvf_005833 [Paramecium bursaria]